MHFADIFDLRSALLVIIDLCSFVVEEEWEDTTTPINLAGGNGEGTQVVR